MARGNFVPMKDARHRIAALALYRALVRTGQKIPLPETLQPNGPVHPVVDIIRRRVRKNRTVSSSRLLFAAMAAGYKFLTMLTKAQSPNNPEYEMITKHLHKIRREAEESREISKVKNPPRSRSRIPALEKPPLLTKISPQGKPPQYVSIIRPAPKSTFYGDRKVPVLSATADGLPYLRITKPTSSSLSGSLRHKKMMLMGRRDTIDDIEESRQPLAREEDNWEYLVQKALENEGLGESGPPEGPFSSYERSEQLSAEWLYIRLRATWKDTVARGEAFNQLQQEEKNLAILEQCMPHWTEEQAKAVTEQVEAEYRERRSIEPAAQPKPVTDPFLSSWWQNRVARSEQTKFAAMSERSKRRFPDWAPSISLPP